MRTRLGMRAGLLCGMTALSPLAASAQTFGVKGGISFFKPVVADAGTSTFYSSRAGLAAGVFAGRQLSEAIGLQAEGLIVDRRLTVTRFDPVQAESRVSVTYFDVPILVRVGGGAPGARFRALTGPTLSMKIAARAEDDMFEPSEVAWTFGGAAEIGRLIIDARYKLGLTDVASGPERYTSRNVMLMVGIRLK